MSRIKLTRFAVYAWSVLVYNSGVILWGAYVRATGSGAGCGSHWPLCNGEVLPHSTQVEAIIEFTHRLTSGLAMLLVVGLLVWALRAYPKGHVVRLGAGYALLFIITEALIGAGLVLFEWVADDVSMGRVISISLHLVNTLVLLTWLTLTAWWGSGGEAIDLSGYGAIALAFGLGMLGLVVLGVTGAITALGDTLFPSASLAEGIQQDFSSTANFLVRLRVWHPIIAVCVSFYLIFVVGIIGMFRTSRRIKRLVLALVILLVVQLAAGLVNLALLAPVWMQILHLLLADMVWISTVLLGAANFAKGEMSQAPVPITQPIPRTRPLP